MSKEILKEAKKLLDKLEPYLDKARANKLKSLYERISKSKITPAAQVNIQVFSELITKEAIHLLGDDKPAPKVTLLRESHKEMFDEIKEMCDELGNAPIVEKTVSLLGRLSIVKTSEQHVKSLQALYNLIRERVKEKREAEQKKQQEREEEDDVEEEQEKEDEQDNEPSIREFLDKEIESAIDEIGDDQDDDIIKQSIEICRKK